MEVKKTSKNEPDTAIKECTALPNYNESELIKSY